MTKREFYTTIASMKNMPAELVEFATEAITQMDKPTKTQLENAPLLEAITNALGAEAQTAADIGAKLEVSTQKASALLRQLVANGVAVQSEAKGRKTYSVAQ